MRTLQIKCNNRGATVTHNFCNHKTTNMTRIAQYHNEVSETSKKIIRENMPEPYRIMIERCEMTNPSFIVDRLTQVPQTKEAEYLSAFAKCKRKEATDIIYISKWDDVREDWVYLRHAYYKSLAINNQNCQNLAA